MGLLNSLCTTLRRKLLLEILPTTSLFLLQTALPASAQKSSAASTTAARNCNSNGFCEISDLGGNHPEEYLRPTAAGSGCNICPQSDLTPRGGNDVALNVDASASPGITAASGIIQDHPRSTMFPCHPTKRCAAVQCAITWGYPAPDLAATNF